MTKTKASTKATTSPTKSKDEGVEDIKRMISELNENLTDKIDSLRDELRTQIDNNHADLKEAIFKVDFKTQQALEKASYNEECISDIRADLKVVLDTNNALQTQLNLVKRDLNDQIDRSLRNTLIFKDINLSPNEKSWEDTESHLADTIHSHCPELDKNFIKSNIERGHRGRRNSNPNSKPHIYVKFTSWKVAEQIKSNIIINNKKRKSNIKVSPMFSKETSSRNNNALKERKQLIMTNPNMEYIVAYPAKILDRNKITKGDYKLIKEF